MMSFLYLLQALHALTTVNVPAGSQLQIRMKTPVASWSSSVGTPLRAVLIAPVFANRELLLPAGCTLAGRIHSVTRVGLGVRHERASLRLEFTQITLPGGEAHPLAAEVIEVDNGRERVSAGGLIEGIRATNSISYRVSGYIKMMLLWHFHAEIAEWAIKSLVVQLPEPEISYPAGTELTLSVTKEMHGIARPVQEQGERGLTDMEFDLRGLAASMPSRTSDPESGRLSDLTNVLLIGSQEQISAAFESAGWTAASALSMRSRIGYIRAAAEFRGYTAPMNTLLLNGAVADMCWQKGLNDVSKRHHIRVWKQPGLWNGQELWMAAATRDIDFAYLRPGRRAFTHRIDANVDREREKVANDLAFASGSDPVRWIARPEVPSFAQNGTGDAFVTDRRLAVIRFRDGMEALSIADDAGEPEKFISRGGRWQRLLRREILVTRSDLLRANIYWRLFEAGRNGFTYLRERRRRLQTDTLLARSRPGAVPPRWQALSLALASLR